MARMPRLAIAGQPHLVIQRSPPGRPAFLVDADRSDYLGALRETARDGEVAIHAFALLDDTVCLLLTPADAGALGRFMQRLNRRYVPAFHRRHGGSGSLWAGRFQTCVLDPEHYLLPATLWIEQAPVRAGAVRLAGDWPWSSAGHHLGRGAIPWMVEHESYWRIGNTPFEREARHGTELQRLLRAEQVAQLEKAARGGWPLGSADYVAALPPAGGRPLRPSSRGRPRRPAAAGG